MRRTVAIRLLVLAATSLLGASCRRPDVPGTDKERTVAESATAPKGTPPSAAATTSSAENEKAERADQDARALGDFRATLDPYGTWSDDSNFGTVWTPAAAVVGENFSPYVSHGHWVYDGHDLAWVSSFDWGWAPFHFGRWVQVGKSWGWIPGRAYAGAWANWRVGPSGFPFIGWAPRPPSWGWRDGHVFRFDRPFPSPYVFCRVGELFDAAVGRRVILNEQVTGVASQTRMFAVHRDPAGFVVRGPGPEEIGVPTERVVTATGDEPGLVKARDFGGVAQPKGLPKGSSEPNP